jgi:hypothetical protein
VPTKKSKGPRYKTVALLIFGFQFLAGFMAARHVAFHGLRIYPKISIEYISHLRCNWVLFCLFSFSIFT